MQWLINLNVRVLLEKLERKQEAAVQQDYYGGIEKPSRAKYIPFGASCMYYIFVVYCKQSFFFLSCLCFEGFSPRSPVFLSPQNQP